MKTFGSILLIVMTFWSLFHGQAHAQYAWIKDPGNPVLSGGAAGSWNYELLNPSVLFNTDSSRYEMWFAATTGTPPWTIGFATSKDGASWSMYPSPVLSPDPGAWDQFILIYASVVRENHQYKMWYSAMTSSNGPGSIGYATSPDGIHWTKYPSNPILGPGTALWERGGPVQCSVMSVPGGYKMWYAAWKATNDTTRIGYATSTDGLNWQRDTVHNPILDVGAPGQWDARAVLWPTVLFLQNKYFMWYQGQQVYSRGYQSAGVATSSDGITNWGRFDGNPVFTVTPLGWDQAFAEFATVVFRNDTLHAWYDGEVPAGPMHIGHAISPLIPDGVGSDVVGEFPKEFSLEQNYPNPFNPTTGIEYRTPNTEQVVLKVFDLLGREVAVLVNGRKNAGAYEVKFDASGLATGVYLYRLTAGGFVQTRKMIVVK